MASLHKIGLLHNDLKAANVLVGFRLPDRIDYLWRAKYPVYLTDFESSVGIVGTGFWRAPEVLLALKDRSPTPETFTQHTDVYSYYAMTCYEVITDREPFEGHPKNEYDIVLLGDRPELPDNIDPQWKDLVSKCWHEDPLQRPSFVAIIEQWNEMY